MSNLLSVDCVQLLPLVAALLLFPAFLGVISTWLYWQGALLDLVARVLKECSVSVVVWSFPCSYHCRESLAVYRLR